MADRGFTKAGRSGAVFFLVLAILPWIAHGGTIHPPEIHSLSGLIERFDSSGCRECHEAIYRQWESSHHARPLMGLNDWIFLSKYLKEGALAVRSAREATRANFPCAKCHLPQLSLATDEAVKELAAAILKDDKETVRKLGITCLVCHQEKANVHHRPETDALYGSRELRDHGGKYSTVRQSPVMKDPVFCGQCHGQGPNLDTFPPVQCATLYGSYLHAYIPAGGTQTCQDCHMPHKDHSVRPNFNDRDETSARLAAALPMEVQVLAYTFHPAENVKTPMIVVRTRITSKAGHRIPDG